MGISGFTKFPWSSLSCTRILPGYFQSLGCLFICNSVKKILFRKLERESNRHRLVSREWNASLPQYLLGVSTPEWRNRIFQVLLDYHRLQKREEFHEKLTYLQLASFKSSSFDRKLTGYFRDLAPLWDCIVAVQVTWIHYYALHKSEWTYTVEKRPLNFNTGHLKYIECRTLSCSITLRWLFAKLFYEMCLKSWDARRYEKIILNFIEIYRLGERPSVNDEKLPLPRRGMPI